MEAETLAPPLPHKVPELIAGPAAGEALPEDTNWGVSGIHWLGAYARGASVDSATAEEPEVHRYVRVTYRPLGASAPIIAFVHEDAARDSTNGLDEVLNWLVDRAFAPGPRDGLVADLEGVRRRILTSYTSPPATGSSDASLVDEAIASLRGVGPRAFAGRANL